MHSLQPYATHLRIIPDSVEMFWTLSKGYYLGVGGTYFSYGFIASQADSRVKFNNRAAVSHLSALVWLVQHLCFDLYPNTLSNLPQASKEKCAVKIVRTSAVE